MLRTIVATPTLFALLSLAASPVFAAQQDNPAPRSPIAAVSHYGPYVGIGSGWGGGYRGRHHRRGSTAGDILTGVLILGTIAAVANATKRNSERRSYPQRYPDPDRRFDRRDGGPQGLDGAANQCLREVERNARARDVSRVERTASGWRVQGSMADGASFSCSIGADGRIDRVDIGGRAATSGHVDTGVDRQYDDETYRSAAARVDETVPQPAYPGGPLPGEDEAEIPQS